MVNIASRTTPQRACLFDTGRNPLEREGGYFPSTAKPCQAGDLPELMRLRQVFAPVLVRMLRCSLLQK
jgi:hypothetical protein